MTRTLAVHVTRTRSVSALRLRVEHLPHEVANEVVVLDEQHRLRPRLRRRPLRPELRRRRGDLLRRREVELEARAFTGPALDEHGAAALTDDAVDGREAETRAAAL